MHVGPLGAGGQLLLLLKAGLAAPWGPSCCRVWWTKVTGCLGQKLKYRMGWGVWARGPEMGFLIMLKCQEGIQARLPDQAICPPQLLETGRLGSHGRPDAPCLLKVWVTLETRKPGSYTGSARGLFSKEGHTAGSTVVRHGEGLPCLGWMLAWVAWGAWLGLRPGSEELFRKQVLSKGRPWV